MHNFFTKKYGDLLKLYRRGVLFNSPDNHLMIIIIIIIIIMIKIILMSIRREELHFKSV